MTTRSVTGSFLVVLLCLSAGSVSAADLFGLGSRNAALVGSVSTVCDDGHAAWYNPALLAATNQGGLALSYISMFPSVAASLTDYGSLGRVPAYQAGSGSGPDLSAAATRARIDGLYSGAADLDRFSGLGVSFAVRMHTLFPKLPFALVFGGSALIPEDGRSLASFSAQTVEQPFFPSWNTPFNQLRMNLGLGAEVWPEHLWLGAGVSVHSRVRGGVNTYNPVASYDADNPGNNPPALSAADTQQSLGLAASLTAGVMARVAPWARLSLVYHGEEETTIDLKADATMELDLGEPLTMAVPYIMSGTFAYRPHRVVGGVAWLWRERLTVTAELEFGLWQEFADHLQILAMAVDPEVLGADGTIVLEDLGGSFRVASQGVPEVRLRNTWNPRFGLEYRFAMGLSVRAGYGYRMAPLTADQGHVNAFMDNNWHTVGLGLGYDLSGDPERPDSLRIDLHGQGLFLEPRYQAVGKVRDDGEVMAAGTVLTEGFMAGFGVELSARF